MTIDTTRFGAVEIEESRLVTIQDGLLGFEGVEAFCLIEHGPDSPFCWLQAVENPELAFVTINPFDFFPAYDLEITDADAERLALSSADDALVLTLVTLTDDAVTTNLLGPIIVNRHGRQARQVVLNNSPYSTRHALVSEAEAVCA